MIGDIYFTSLTKIDDGNMTFEKGKTSGEGTIGNSFLYVNDVNYVKGLKQNLLTVKPTM